jgi:hypothetical protein
MRGQCAVILRARKISHLGVTIAKAERAIQRPFISTQRNSLRIIRFGFEEEDAMERRNFLKLAFGFAAGAATLAASAQAAPLLPQPLSDSGRLPDNEDAHPAVTTRDEVDHLQPEEVRWGHHGWGHHGHHHGWGHRHWGWRHRHWHRHHWHRRHW